MLFNSGIDRGDDPQPSPLYKPRATPSVMSVQARDPPAASYPHPAVPGAYPSHPAYFYPQGYPQDRSAPLQPTERTPAAAMYPTEGSAQYAGYYTARQGQQQASEPASRQGESFAAQYEALQQEQRGAARFQEQSGNSRLSPTAAGSPDIPLQRTDFHQNRPHSQHSERSTPVNHVSPQPPYEPGSHGNRLSPPISSQASDGQQELLPHGEYDSRSPGGAAHPGDSSEGEKEVHGHQDLSPSINSNSSSPRPTNSSSAFQFDGPTPSFDDLTKEAENDVAPPPLAALSAMSPSHPSSHPTSHLSMHHYPRFEESRPMLTSPNVHQHSPTNPHIKEMAVRYASEIAENLTKIKSEPISRHEERSPAEDSRTADPSSMDVRETGHVMNGHCSAPSPYMPRPFYMKSEHRDTDEPTDLSARSSGERDRSYSGDSLEEEGGQPWHKANGQTPSDEGSQDYRMSRRDSLSPGFPPYPGSADYQPTYNKEGIEVFYCHLCTYVATQKFHFDAHMATHFDQQCPHCDYTSRTEGRLKRHIKDFHSEDPPENFSGMKVVRREPSKPKMFKCRQCEYCTEIKVEFWDHARSHIKEDKVLQCPKCPFVTEYKHHLEYHLRNHFGSKPYKCNKCNYACVNKSMLNSHMKSHTNVYQYRCADCTYATKYCHSLKLHLKKYNHGPATVLNTDGSLPCDGSGDFELVSKRGPPRGPRGPRKDKSPSPTQEQGLPAVGLQGVGAGMPNPLMPGSSPGFWPGMPQMPQMPGAMMTHGTPISHPGYSIPPPLVPINANNPLGLPLTPSKNSLPSPILAANSPQGSNGVKSHSEKKPTQQHHAKMNNHVNNSIPEKSPMKKLQRPHLPGLPDMKKSMHGLPNPGMLGMFGMPPDALLEMMHTAKMTGMPMPGGMDPMMLAALARSPMKAEMPMVPQLPQDMAQIWAMMAMNPSMTGLGPPGLNHHQMMAAAAAAASTVAIVKPQAGAIPKIPEHRSPTTPPFRPKEPSVKEKINQSLAQDLAANIEAEARNNGECPLDLTAGIDQPQDTNRLSPGLKRKQDVDENGHAGENPAEMPKDGSTPPRKRSRKGKAYKLDTICLKLQERRTSPTDFDDEGNEEYYSDYAGSEDRMSGDSNVGLPMHVSIPDEKLPSRGPDSLSDKENQSAGDTDAEARVQETLSSLRELSQGTGPALPGHIMETSNSVNRRKPFVSRRLDTQFDTSSEGKVEEIKMGALPVEMLGYGSKLSAEEAAARLPPGSDYECQHCDIVFKDCIMYTMHMGYHGYQDPFKCNMCGQCCGDKVAFFLHIARTAHE